MNLEGLQVDEMWIQNDPNLWRQRIQWFPVDLDAQGTNSTEASTRPAMLGVFTPTDDDHLTMCVHMFHLSKTRRLSSKLKQQVPTADSSSERGKSMFPFLPMQTMQTVKKLAMCLAKLLHHTWRYSGDKQPLAIGTG